MKKTFVVFSAILAVFAMVSVSHATSTSTVTVTSNPIQQNSACDKAGGLTITWGPNSVLTAGDQITGDLPLGVTLCKNINFEISAGGNALNTAGNRFVAGTTAAPTNTVPGGGFELVGDAVNTVTTGAAGLYFQVVGVAGSQRVTIYVLGDAGTSITVGAVNTDAAILRILGQGLTNIYTPETVSGATVYDVAGTVADNTLCINVTGYTGQTVNMSLNSTPSQPYTFIPSNPEVAHIITPELISLYNCKGDNPGRIAIGSTSATQSGTSDSCIAFDNENGAGYCTSGSSLHYNNKLVIHNSSGSFTPGDYTVTLQILVNGQAGDHGVYFTNQAVGYEAFSSGTDVCSASTTAGAPNAVGTQANYTYLNASGATLVNTDIGAPRNDDCSTISATARAVTLTTDTSSLGLTSGMNYVWIDMPAFNYDPSMVNAGDVVTVKVTLTLPPCTSVFTGTFNVGTFGCVVTPPSYTLLFPYFTPMNGSEGFWNGIAIINKGTTSGTITFTVYEQDGDVGTYTVPTPVAGNSMYRTLLSNILSGMTVSGTGSGVLGDSPCYIVVTTTFNADGFGMIADPANGTSMGYLPRLSNVM